MDIHDQASGSDLPSSLPSNREKDKANRAKSGKSSKADKPVKGAAKNRRFSEAATEKNRPFSAAICAAKRNRPYNGANLMNLASSVDFLSH